jgi:hypothetical protein
MIENEMQKNVDEWINSQGFPLEMLAEKQFNAQGFKTSISEYYEDYETKKHREIDVTAILNELAGSRFLTQVIFKIECKYTKKFPWVLFTRSKTDGDNHPWLPLLYSKHGAYLFSQMREDATEMEIANHTFHKTERIGYGIVQSIKPKDEDKEDLAFKACSSAFKASWHTILKTNLNPSPLEFMLVLTLAIPVVLIDGKLFECFLNDSGKTNTREIKSGIMEWKYSNPNGGSTHLHIVTKEFLSEFTNQAKSFAQIFANATIKHTDALLSAIKIEQEKRIPTIASAPARRASSLLEGY